MCLRRPVEAWPVTSSPSLWQHCCRCGCPVWRRRCYKGYASSYAATEPSIGRDASSTGRGPIGQTPTFKSLAVLLVTWLPLWLSRQQTVQCVKVPFMCAALLMSQGSRQLQKLYSQAGFLLQSSSSSSQGFRSLRPQQQLAVRLFSGAQPGQLPKGVEALLAVRQPKPCRLWHVDPSD